MLTKLKSWFTSKQLEPTPAPAKQPEKRFKSRRMLIERESDPAVIIVYHFVFGEDGYLEKRFDPQDLDKAVAYAFDTLEEFTPRELCQPRIYRP